MTGLEIERQIVEGGKDKSGSLVIERFDGKGGTITLGSVQVVRFAVVGFERELILILRKETNLLIFRIFFAGLLYLGMLTGNRAGTQLSRIILT